MIVTQCGKSKYIPLPSLASAPSQKRGESKPKGTTIVLLVLKRDRIPFPYPSEEEVKQLLDRYFAITDMTDRVQGAEEIRTLFEELKVKLDALHNEP